MNSTQVRDIDTEDLPKLTTENRCSFTSRSSIYKNSPFAINANSSPSSKLIFATGDTSSLNFNSMHMALRDIGSPYCTKDNAKQAIDLLSKELICFGYPPLINEDSETCDYVVLVNITHELLQTIQRSIKVQEDLENKNIRIAGEYNTLHANCSKLKEILELTERKVASSQEKERQLNIQNKILSSKLKTERDEVKRLNSILIQRESQYQHDIRKRERESTRLKERLNHSLSDRSKDKRLGMDILNKLQRKDGARSRWQTSNQENKQEEEMYQKLIANYEERHRMLVEENNGLRDLLAYIQKEASTIFQECLNSNKNILSDSVLEEDCRLMISFTEEKNFVTELPDGFFQMPLEQVQEKIKNYWTEKCLVLKQYIQKMEEAQRCLNENIIYKGEKISFSDYEQLQEKVQQYAEVIGSQEQLLRQVLLSSSSETDRECFMLDGHLLEEKEKLESEKILLASQKCSLEKERELISQAISKLSHQKRKFEQERADLVRRYFSEFKTPSPASSQKQMTSFDGINSPSTPDLFKFLSIPASPFLNHNGSEDKIDSPESINIQSHPQ